MKKKITAILLVIALVLSLGLVTAAPVAASPGSIVGLWHFDGDATDSSGNGNDGTLGGGASFTTSGKFDGAVELDGIDSIVTIPHSISLNLDTAITVEAWIYADSLGSQAGIIRKGLYPTDIPRSWGLDIQSGKARFFIYDGGTAYIAYSDTVSTGAWHHLVGTYDGSTVDIYLDGDNTSSTSASHSGDIDTNTNPITIGKRHGSYFFDGTIDKVRIWNEALSADDIEESYSLRDVEITKKLTRIAWDDVVIEDEDGIPGVPIVPIETVVTFTMEITVTNNSLVALSDVVVKDNLGGDLKLVSTDVAGEPNQPDITWTPGPGNKSTDTDNTLNITVQWTGKTDKVHLWWNIPSLAPATPATLTLVVQTDENPGGGGPKFPHQEYTSTGDHELNSGATLSFCVEIAEEKICLVLAGTDELEVEAVSQQPLLGSTGGASAVWDSKNNGDGDGSFYLTSGTVTAGDEARIKIWLPSGTTLGDIDSISWWVWAVTGYPPHIDITLDSDNNPGVVNDDEMLTAEFAYNNVSAPAWSVTYNTWWLETFETTSSDGFDSVNNTTILWVTKMGAGILDAPSGTLADWQDGLLTNNPGSDPLSAGDIDGSAKVLYIEIEVDNWIAESEAYVDDIVVTLD